MINLCIVSTKGGVGKTTLTANLGGYLADHGQRVLLVDADVQPTLSSYFELRQRAGRGLTELIVDGAAEDVVSQTVIDGLDVIYSNDPRGELANWILHDPVGRIRLRQALDQPAFRDGYDILLIDTPGAIGPLQDAGVVAADFLVSPIPPEMLSAREFIRGTVAMIERLRPMRFLGAAVGPLRGVIYRQDQTVDARLLAAELRSESFLPGRGAITILDTAVPAGVAYREAATLGRPVHRHDPRRKGVAPCGAEVMAALARELFPHLQYPADAPAAATADGRG
jgi:chromosome partitioning related protein ParA